MLGRPDFVFKKERLVIFVDGCFWHACPKHGRKPGSNLDYWLSKLERNQARDIAINRELRRKGWRVLRIWEHALLQPKVVAGRCQRMLSKSSTTCSLDRKEAKRFGLPVS